MKNKRRYIAMLISLLLFIVLAVIIKVTETNFIDNDIYEFISNNLISDNLTPIVKNVTNFASSIFLISLTIVLFVIVKDKKISFSIFTNLFSVFIINNILKIIFKRPRPNVYNIIVEKGYSFPSGHSMVSCAYYGFLIYLVYKYVENKRIKYGLILLLSLIIISIGISRIYLGVHYTTDVLGGYLFATFYLGMFINIIEKYYLKDK